jgi:hypothetical protein
MNRGLIVDWHFQNAVFNQGVIAGCSPDVHGIFFGFTLAGTTFDPGLHAILMSIPQFPVPLPANCMEGPSWRWVNFLPGGGFASHIVRIFP